ncbi:MAG: flagellin [Proteobacteria bacterium]|nr:flagellin [Pseudomonadota bacterium]
MSVSLNTNTAATTAVYDLGVSGKNLKRSLDRLSSGSRINTSFDDAGGLAVSMKLGASIRRTDATIANVNNAISFLQTQEGAIKVADKLLNRMSELTSLAMDVTKSPDDLSLYNTELGELQEQLYAMLDEEFNGVKLFDPGATAATNSLLTNKTDVAPTKTVVVSEDGTQTIGITQSDLDSISRIVGYFNGQAGSMDLSSNSSALLALDRVDWSIKKLAELRAYNGAQQQQLSNAASVLTENKSNMQMAQGRIQDVDVATESTRLASQSIRNSTGAAMLALANQGHQVLLRLLG